MREIREKTLDVRTGLLTVLFMKSRIGILFLLLLITAYATYAHGYFLSYGSKLWLHDLLEAWPLWNLGTYIFIPAYFVISLINPLVEAWQPWMVVGMWIAVHIGYAFGISYLVFTIPAKLVRVRPIGYNNGRDAKQSRD
jgi:hypothetical protein